MTVMDLEAVVSTAWDHLEARTTADSQAAMRIGSTNKDSASLRTDRDMAVTVATVVPMLVVSEEWAEWEAACLAAAAIWVVSTVAVTKHLNRLRWRCVCAHCCRRRW